MIFLSAVKMHLKSAKKSGKKMILQFKNFFCLNPENGELTSAFKIVESAREVFGLAGLASKLNCMVYKGILFWRFFFSDFNTC